MSQVVGECLGGPLTEEELLEELFSFSVNPALPLLVLNIKVKDASTKVDEKSYKCPTTGANVKTTALGCSSPLLLKVSLGKETQKAAGNPEVSSPDYGRQEGGLHMTTKASLSLHAEFGNCTICWFCKCRERGVAVKLLQSRHGALVRVGSWNLAPRSFAWAKGASLCCY